jgi:AcrR family transcriptional regulator
VRRICRETNLTSPRFYRLFGSLESLVEQAGLKVDRETLERIRSTRKATKRRIRRKSQRSSRIQIPATTVEGESQEPPAASTFETIQQSLEAEEEARQRRLEDIGKFAAQIEILALDGDPKISGPVLDALSSVVPTILLKKYGVEATIKDLIEAGHTLRQVQEARKKLRAKETHLDGLLKKHEDERVQIQGEREKIRQARKLDPEKIALQDHVKTLQGEKKVLIDNLNETVNNNKRFRLAVMGLLTVIGECGSCKKRFQRIFEPYPDLMKWLLEGQWSLSFEFIDTSKLPSRT